MNQFDWEKTNEETAKILQWKELESELIIPESIEGLPLTEVGPHCFAGNKYLERIVLPNSVKKIERMAFYNCTKLKEIEFGPGFLELGGDAFMNCHQLHNLIIRCKALEKSGARLVLQQISSDLRVHFLGEKKEEEAIILFPEYYETYDEVAPAHLFGRNIEGEGFRARQCFKEDVLEYRRYDSIFQKACAEEKVDTLCEMALNRLQYPIHLNEHAKNLYEIYCKEHIFEIGKKAVKHRNQELLHFICKTKLITREKMDILIPIAAENDWAEGVALLIRLKEAFFPITTKKERYIFDDF